jgi:hypothetical protein
MLVGPPSLRTHVRRSGLLSVVADADWLWTVVADTSRWWSHPPSSLVTTIIVGPVRCWWCSPSSLAPAPCCLTRPICFGLGPSLLDLVVVAGRCPSRLTLVICLALAQLCLTLVSQSVDVGRHGWPKPVDVGSSGWPWTSWPWTSCSSILAGPSSSALIPRQCVFRLGCAEIREALSLWLQEASCKTLSSLSTASIRTLVASSLTIVYRRSWSFPFDHPRASCRALPNSGDPAILWSHPILMLVFVVTLLPIVIPILSPRSSHRPWLVLLISHRI